MLLRRRLFRAGSAANRRRAGVTALVGMLSVLAGGCALLPWLGRTIEMPLAPWPGYEYFYLAEKKRLAEAIGLTMQTKQFADPQAIVQAYLRGDLQVAQLTTVEVVDLCARLPQRCPVVVLVLDESRGADMVAARPEYQTIEQLSGARVAVTPSTLGPYVLSRALEREGLSLADVTVVPMPLGRMAGALQRREVEAAAFFPPFSDYSLRVGLARRLFDSSRIPGEIFDVLAVDPHIATHHRKELVLLLRTWQAAHDLAAREPDMADRLMADWEQLSVQRFREDQSGLLYPSLREQVPLLQVGGVLDRNLRAVQRVQQTLGLLKPGAPVPRVDDRPLLEALRSAAP